MSEPTAPVVEAPTPAVDVFSATLPPAFAAQTEVAALVPEKYVGLPDPPAPIEYGILPDSEERPAVCWL
jgi:hypothetical protein